MAIGNDAQAIIEAINALKSEISTKEGDSATIKTPGGKMTGETQEEFDARIEKFREMLNEQMKLNTAKAEGLRLDFEISSSLLDREEKMKNLLALDKQKQAIIELLQQAQNDLGDEERERLENELANITNVLDKNEDLLESYKNLTEAQKRAMKMGSDAADKLANKFGLTTKAGKTMTGQMIKFTKTMKEAGASTQFMKSFGASMLNLPLSLLDSIVKTMIDMMFALDGAQTSFNKATGFAGKYNAQIGKLSESHLHLGITAKEAGSAFTALATTFSDVSLLSEKQADALALSAARLEALGVAGEKSFKIMDFFNKVGGSSVEVLGDMAEKFLTSGINIGFSQQRMANDFIAALPKLAVYGNRAQEIFLDLAAAAKNAGVETSSLLNVAGKFDTFAGAAEATGKLNAILGTQMSSTEMLMMTEEERIETLILQVQSSGMAFRDMDKFTQMAIAASVGITDMNEANRIFGMSLGVYQEHQAEMAKSAKEQEEFDKAIAKTIPVQRQLQLGFMQLATDFGPQLLEVIREFTEYMLENGSAIKKNVKIFALLYAGVRIGLPLLGVLGKVFGVFTGALGLNTAAQTTNAGAQQMSNVQMVAQGKLMRGTGVAALGLAAKIAAVGAAILLAGVGIYIAVQGFVELAGAMSQMQDNVGAFVAVVGLLVAGFVGLAIALVGMTAAGAPAAPVLLAVGAAVALMGLGIGLAAAGIGFMAQGFSEMGIEGLIAVGVIGLFATIMYALTPALFSGSVGVAALGTAATASAPGLLILAKAILIVSVGVGIMAAAFALMFDRAAAFGKAIKGTAEDSKAMAAALTEMGFAAILNGNPIALAGLAAQTLFAKSQKTTVDFGGAEGLKDMAEGMERTATLASTFEGVAANMTSIAAGLAEIDTALGSGEKRIEIVSTLEHLATLSTAGAGDTITRATTATATAGATTASQKIVVENKFGPLTIVLEDGTELKGFINRTRDAAERFR